VKSLYDETFRYTERAGSLDLETAVALKPLFKEAFEAGFNPREIAHIMHQVIVELELDYILDTLHKHSTKKE
jgi:hypothetical protein